MQPIIPNLWMDENVEEAVDFYTSLFENSKITNKSRFSGPGEEIHGRKAGDVMQINFELAGERFSALNGGPFFKFNPAISFFATCQSQAEFDDLWEKLSQGGQILMPLDSYAWSKRYSWTQDRFGMSWQITLEDLDRKETKVSPFLMFISKEKPLAESAINFYTSIFRPSKIKSLSRFEEGEEGPKDGVKQAEFILHQRLFRAFDSAPVHDFTFNEAVSFIIECDTQEEIDYFWKKLSEGGDPNARQCGWLKDKFGVSWQVVPKVLGELTRDYKSEKARKVTEAMLKMKKLNIKALKEA